MLEDNRCRVLVNWPDVLLRDCLVLKDERLMVSVSNHGELVIINRLGGAEHLDEGITVAREPGASMKVTPVSPWQLRLLNHRSDCFLVYLTLAVSFLCSYLAYAAFPQTEQNYEPNVNYRTASEGLRYLKPE